MVDWADDQQCRSRRRAHAWVETVGAGAGKSGCFSGVLRWSVGRHGSSDLDASSFVPSGHKVISIKAHCLWADAD